MKKTLLFVFLLWVHVLQGCSGGGGSSSSENTAPVAVITAQTNLTTGVSVVLDGSQSSDADGDALTYLWQIVSLPNNSTVQQFSPNSTPATSTTFTPDYDGTYVFSLVVNDGKVDSNMATISINSFSSQNLSPTVSFSINKYPTAPLGDIITFSWTARDTNNDTLSCTLDLTGGGNMMVEIDDCVATATYDYVYQNGGSYLPRITVYDGKGGVAVADTHSIQILSSMTIYIRNPTSNQLVGASLEIDVTVNSEIEINTARAQVADRETILTSSGRVNVASLFYGIIPLDGLNRGEQVLEIRAEDALGTVAFAYLRFIFDKKPELVISQPSDGSVATPTLPLDIVCLDDSGPCEIKVWDVTNYPATPGIMLATGIDKVVGEIDLSAYIGYQRTLLIRGTDSLGQYTDENRTVFVESPEHLSLVTLVAGQILDLGARQLLYLNRSADGDSLYAYNWLADIITTVSVPSGKKINDAPTGPQGVLTPNGLLTPTGAIYFAEDTTYSPLSGRLYDWRNGELNEFPGTTEFAVSGDYAIWTEPTEQTLGVTIWLRRFSDGSNTLVSTVAGSPDSVGSNGVVAYWSEDDFDIFTYTRGVTNRLTNDSYQNTNPVTDGNAFVYRKTDNSFIPPKHAIAYHNGTTEIILTEFRETVPYPGTNYQINNGWVAYTEIGNSEQLHVWTRTPQGELLRRTVFSASSYIDKLGDDGSVMLTNVSKRYLSLVSGELIHISASSYSIPNQNTYVKPFQVDGKWYIAIDNSLFEVR